MRWRRREVKRATKCTGATFSLTRKEREECFEGVDSFKYLNPDLHQTYKDWLTVRQNIWRGSNISGDVLRNHLVYCMRHLEFLPNPDDLDLWMNPMVRPEDGFQYFAFFSYIWMV